MPLCERVLARTLHQESEGNRVPMDAKEVVEQFWKRVWLSADVEAAGGLVAEDVVLHLFGATDSGIDAWKQSTQVYFTALPDFRASVDFTVIEEEMVTVKWTGSGTHDGELRGAAPTGRPVEISGVAIFRVENGQIAEIWSQPDQLGLLKQIGLA